MKYPYPGLRPFRRDEPNLFFGRQKQIDELHEHLTSSHLLVVVGPTGCGKSSLVGTGLIPSLISDEEKKTPKEAKGQWMTADMHPGDRAMMELARALNRSIQKSKEHEGIDKEDEENRAAFLEADLERGPLGLVDALERASLPKNTRFLLLVDQFEEIFRCPEKCGKEEVDAFVALLLESTRSEHPAIYIVIVIRSDYLANCQFFPGLPQAVNKGMFLVPYLDRGQLLEAIEGPALAAGARVEPALTNRLCNEMAADPHRLPSLQHTLDRIWLLATEGGAITGPIELTMAHYREIGRIKKALNADAEKIFDALPSPSKPIAERLFRCLTERDTEGREWSSPRRLREIAAIADVASEDLVPVVETFHRSGRGFLTSHPEQEPPGPDTLLAISHEILIRRWRRLSQWVDAEADSAAMYRRALDTARRWRDGKADLWEGEELDEALEWKKAENFTGAWAEQYGGEIELVDRFLREGEQAEGRQRAAKERDEGKRLRKEHLEAEKWRIEAKKWRNEAEKWRTEAEKWRNEAEK